MDTPKHIVLFPDGNRRWAKAKNLSIQEGYLAGEQKFHDFLFWCKKRSVTTVTVFGFSTENWKRPKEQVDFLMHLLEKYLGEGIGNFNKEQVKVKIIGEREKLPLSLKNTIETVEAATQNNSHMHLNLAVSYGGKWDILNAVKEIIKENVPLEKINEDLMEKHLSTVGQPAPDLIIRAGGQMRLSNFVLWQAAYSELYFSEKMWPDFSEEDLEKALLEFDSRQRRYGK